MLLSACAVLALLVVNFFISGSLTKRIGLPDTARQAAHRLPILGNMFTTPSPTAPPQEAPIAYAPLFDFSWLGGIPMPPPDPFIPWAEISKRVLFMIPVRAHAVVEPHIISNTWRMDTRHAQMVFVGNCSACEFGAELPEGRGPAMTTKMFKMMSLALQRYPERDFYIKVDADTVVLANNLYGWLSHKKFDPNEPVLIGSVLRSLEDGNFTRYVNGGAGYVFTRAALQRMAGNCDDLFSLVHEDHAMGVCAARTGVRLEHCPLMVGDRFDTLLIHMRTNHVNPTHQMPLLIPRYPMSVHPFKLGDDFHSSYQLLKLLSVEKPDQAPKDWFEALESWTTSPTAAPVPPSLSAAPSLAPSTSPSRSSMRQRRPDVLRPDAPQKGL